MGTVHIDTDTEREKNHIKIKAIYKSDSGSWRTFYEVGWKRNIIWQEWTHWDVRQKLHYSLAVSVTSWA